jgi:integrase
MLTVRTVQTRRDGWHHDQHGLYLQVTANGAGRSWVYRYTMNGRQRYIGLGPAHTISLARARELARECRELRLRGIDPIEARKAQRAATRLEAAKTMTFGECVEAYLQTHEVAWRNAKHREQWHMTLTKYCKSISDLPVSDIDTHLVLKVLTPLWTTRTETAKRLRGRIERVLAWAKGRGLRDGENPARWAAHLDEMLPSPAKIAPVRHHPALPYAEIPQFMAELRSRDSLSARALEFTILVAARTGEVIGATWDEIDLKAKMWVVPAAKMKGGREHRVPLCERAMEILQGLDRRSKRPFSLSSMAMLELLRGMRPGLTVHGTARSAFVDWAHECSNHPKTVIDMALAHKISDQVEASYRRGNLYQKRQLLMNSWGQYCEKAPSKVLPFAKALDGSPQRV